MALASTNDSATISTTEYSLPRDANYASGTPATTVARIRYVIDFNAVVAGADEFRVRAYRHINGTQRVVFEALVNNPGVLELDEFWGYSEGWDVTVLKTAGTDRAVPWTECRDTSPSTLDANVLTWLGSTPNALTAGRVECLVGSMANSVLTAGAINSAAITSGKFGAGAIDAAAIATDAIGAAELAADAVTEVRDSIFGYAYEGSETYLQFTRLARARLYGKATVPAGDGSYAYRDLADTKNRIAGAIAATARTLSTVDGT